MPVFPPTDVHPGSNEIDRFRSYPSFLSSQRMTVRELAVMYDDAVRQVRHTRFVFESVLENNLITSREDQMHWFAVELSQITMQSVKLQERVRSERDNLTEYLAAVIQPIEGYSLTVTITVEVIEPEPILGEGFAFPLVIRFFSQN